MMRPSVVLLLVSVIKCEVKFTAEDFDVVAHLSGFLSSPCFVFVGDNRDVELLNRIRAFSRDGLYSSVLGFRLLENILQKEGTQLRFFQRRTVIVAKELNLTSFLHKILVPRLLTWIVFENYNKYKTSYIPFNRNVLFVDTLPDMVTASQVYHAKPGGGESVKIVWTWMRSELANPKPPFALKHNRNNFYNVSLRAHYIYEKDICRDTRERLMRIKIECLQRDIMEFMGRRLNFSLVYKECLEKKHPYTYPNGSESVLFKSLENEEVDISIPSHIIGSFRMSKYSYVWPTFVLRSMMYLKQTKSGSYWTSYLRPLNSSIWCGIFAWILITGFLLLLFEKILFKKLKFGISLVIDFIHSVLKALQVFCSQAVVDIPTFASIRILYLLKLFAFVIFFQAYCGYLASSLTIVVPYYPFKDLKGFFEKKEYQLMTLRQEIQRFYYRKVIGIGKRPNFMLADEDLPRSVREGISRLCGNFHLAFVDFRENLLDIDAFKCKLIELPSPISHLYLGLASPKNSPYSEFINKELIYMRSTGIMNRLNSRLYPHLHSHDKKNNDDYIMVSMTEVFPVFCLLGMATFLSFAIFTAEVLIFKIRNRRTVHRLARNKCQKTKKLSIERMKR